MRDTGPVEGEGEVGVGFRSGGISHSASSGPGWPGADPHLLPGGVLSRGVWEPRQLHRGRLEEGLLA